MVPSSCFYYNNTFSIYNWKVPLMQSYPPRSLDRRLQEDWAKEAREGLRILKSLRVDFGPMG